MELQINNQTKQFTTSTLSVQELLDFEIPTAQNGIAVAVNQQVIAKNNWNSHQLHTNDQILIITATQGG